MGSESAGLPKVMRLALGRPLLAYVMDALSFINRRDSIIVVGYMMDTVTSAFGADYVYAVQAEQLGTGHAVSCASANLADHSGSVLVAAGDMPLVRRETYESLVRAHRESGCACTILSTVTGSPEGYGRIVRDGAGNFAAIVEQRDCTPEQAAICEINSSIYVFDCPALLSALGSLGNSNVQREYYLTDVPAIIAASGGRVGVHLCADSAELTGVNTPEQLEFVEKCLTPRG